MRAARLAALLAALLGPPPLWAAGAAEMFSWLPADTATVTGAPRDRAPMLTWLSSSFQALGKTPPACWKKLTGAVEGSFQIWRKPPDSSEALLVKGRFAREPAEKCLTEGLRTLEPSASLARQGALTRMEGGKLGEAWLGWSKEWLVWAPKKERVEQLLGALGKKGTPPPIAKPLARVDLGTELWMASTIDYTGGPLGVPSRSLVGWLVGGPSGLTMPVALEFASEADAEKAAAALGKLAGDKSLPAPLREGLQALAVTRRRHFLTLDLDPKVWMKPEVMGALQAVVDRK